ncbi:MAG: efflux RND transporter periplasmic adaptor subunit [Verrucomicrobia bacterium]|nr:efflux RND transporter periplasmic adaptor subunit [Verrucomicrobiota bacterium]
MSLNPNPAPRATTPARRQQQPRAKRWLPWLGAGLLVALIIIGFIPRPVPVETTRVTQGKLRATVNEEGKTRIQQRYVISAPVTGHLRRIPFKAGAEVAAGKTVLAVIDPVAPAMLDARNRALAEARRDTAAANLDKAKEAERYAVSELRRIEKLLAESSASQQELEGAQWRATSAAKDFTAAESALREVETELKEFLVSDGSTTNRVRAPVAITSPTSGRVLHVFEESTRVVTAGTPLVTVGDPADLEAIIEVLSRDGAAIAPGAKVELEQWGGGEPLAARVRLVEPAAFLKVSALGVEEQRVNVVVDFVTPYEQRRNLGDNFRVEARIVVWEADLTLKVPAGALFRRGQNWAAFVMHDGRAELRRVTAGRSSGSEMQILDGLKAGEEVILYPGDRVKAGQRVKPIQIAQ